MFPLIEVQIVSIFFHWSKRFSSVFKEWNLIVLRGARSMIKLFAQNVQHYLLANETEIQLSSIFALFYFFPESER